MKKILTLILASILAMPSFASEIKACAKYQRQDDSWSKAYRVRGQLEEGYFVIRWRSGDISKIRMDNLREVPTEFYGTKDDEGRPWKVKQGWFKCN